MNEEALRAYRLGWLTVQQDAARRMSDAISTYADGIRDEDERRAMKAAASHVRVAAKALDALCTQLDDDANDRAQAAARYTLSTLEYAV